MHLKDSFETLKKSKGIFPVLAIFGILAKVRITGPQWCPTTVILNELTQNKTSTQSNLEKCTRQGIILPIVYRFNIYPPPPPLVLEYTLKKG
jgi:hypothetical protein